MLILKSAFYQTGSIILARQLPAVN